MSDASENAASAPLDIRLVAVAILFAESISHERGRGKSPQNVTGIFLRWRGWTLERPLRSRAGLR